MTNFIKIHKKYTKNLLKYTKYILFKLKVTKTVYLHKYGVVNYFYIAEKYTKYILFYIKGNENGISA